MILIKANQWQDLNVLGVSVAIVVGIIMLFQQMPNLIILLVETSLFFYIYWLYRQTVKYKIYDILLNSEDKWFIRDKDKMFEMIFKDYWLVNNHIFIWLKGNKKSVSFVIRRSIIGVDKFSAIRSKII